MKPYKICILTYNQLADLVDGAVARLGDPEVEIMTESCHHAAIYECVKRALGDGAEVFIAGGSNYGIFRESFDLAVVELPLGLADYLRSIRRARRHGRRVAVVSYRAEVPYDFTDLEELMDAEIIKLTYGDSGELRGLIDGCGCDAVVGASFACEAAAAAGKASVLAYSGHDGVIAKIREAKALAAEIRREKSRLRFFTTVIDHAPNAIVGVDSAGVIVNYNPAAERLLGVSAVQARGQPCSRLFPELGMDRVLRRAPDGPDGRIIAYRGRPLHLTRHYVPDGGEGGSAVALLSEAPGQGEPAAGRGREQTGGFTAKNTFDSIISHSEKIHTLIRRAKVYAESGYSILIYGETGTGKELFAQSIHNHSPRKAQSFVAVNCAAIPDTLLESELFGYEDGAFTGSRKGGKKGLFELANGGTIFLDEIGDLSGSMQQKLLRALQEGEIMRVGGDRIIPVDVRVLAATNKSPAGMLENGFRADLFYRLNVLALDIPPLRGRGDDVVHIFTALMGKYTDRYKIPAAVPDGALGVLTHYSWPGNVRELENVCKRFSLLLSQHAGKLSGTAVKQLLCDCIGVQNLLQSIYSRYGYAPGGDGGVDPAMVDDIKRCFGYAYEYIAGLLGVSRTTLWRMMKRG